MATMPSDVVQCRPLYNLDPLPWVLNTSIPGLFADQPSTGAVHPYFMSHEAQTHDPFFKDPPGQTHDPLSSTNGEDQESMDPALSAYSKGEKENLENMDPAIVALSKARDDGSIHATNLNGDLPQRMEEDEPTESDSDDDEQDSVLDGDYDPEIDEPPRPGYTPTPLEAAIIDYDEAYAIQHIGNHRLRTARLKRTFWQQKYRSFFRAGASAPDMLERQWDPTTGRGFGLVAAFNRQRFERKAVRWAEEDLMRSSSKLIRARCRLREKRVKEFGPGMALLEEAALKETGLKWDLGRPGEGSDPVVRMGSYRVSKAGKPVGNGPLPGAKLRLMGKRIV